VIVKIKKIQGLNNVTPPESATSFTVDQDGPQLHTFLTSALNVDINDSGHLMSRLGKTAIDDPCHSLYNTGPYMIGVRDGEIVTVNSSITLVDAGAAGQGHFTYPMTYEKVVNNVYCSDGVFTAVVDTLNNRVRSWGLQEPIAPLVFRNDVAGVGRGRVGNRMVIATYVRSDGQESPASEPTSIMCDTVTESITIEVPPSKDPDVVAVNFFVSTEGGLQTYMAGSKSNTPVGGPYVSFVFDTTAPNQNYRPLLTDSLDFPWPGNKITYFSTKLYVAHENYVMATLSGSYELMTSLDYFFTGSSEITMLESVDDGLWVATRDEIWFFSGASQPFTAVKKAGYGVVKNSSAKTHGLLVENSPATYAVAQTAKGFVRFGNGGEMSPITEKTYRPTIAAISAACITDDRGFFRYLSAYSPTDLQAAQGTFN
jgi:hypothetical protein